MKKLKINHEAETLTDALGITEEAYNEKLNSINNFMENTIKQALEDPEKSDVTIHLSKVAEFLDTLMSRETLIMFATQEVLKRIKSRLKEELFPDLGELSNLLDEIKKD